MKTFNCRDVGIECDWKTTAENEEEVLRRAGEHARKEHGMTQLSDDLKNQIRAKIKEVKAA